jgi:hypothetical protein
MPSKFDIDNMPTIVREREICRDPARAYDGYFPVSRSAWRDGVEAGYYPKPIKIGPKMVGWRREDIMALIQNGVGDRRARSRRAAARALLHARHKAEAEAAKAKTKNKPKKKAPARRPRPALADATP